MHLLYCDESNMEPKEGEFLLYGGVIIPSHRAGALSRRIGKLRADAGFEPDAKLKFNPKPDWLDHDQFKALKQSIIEAAIEHECKLLAYTVLHGLSGDPDQARRYGINTICFHFHCVLNRMGPDEQGIVLIDRFNDANNEIDGHLKEKMSIGVQRSHKEERTKLSTIIGFHYSAIGQSHFTSLIDILIGSLRFAMNVHTRGQDHLRDNARALLEIMSPLFWKEQGEERVPDIGLHFSPMNVKVGKYHSQYVSLQEFLRAGGVDSSQRITNNR